MINRAAYRDLQEAGMDAPQAEVVATYLPDWSQFATKQDLVVTKQDLAQGLTELESRLIRWMMGIFLAMASLLAAAVSVLVAVLG